MFIRIDVFFRLLYSFENTLYGSPSLSFQLDMSAIEDARSMDQFLLSSDVMQRAMPTSRAR